MAAIKRPALLLFSRPAGDSRAKTRLRAGTLSDSLVTALHSAFVADALELLSGSSAQLKFAAWSDERGAAAPDVQSFVQQGRSFGERFDHALAESVRRGAGSLVVIGSDCPLLSPEMIEAALGSTSEGALVVGPAPSAGFYLLGLPPGTLPCSLAHCFQAPSECLCITEALQPSRVKLLPPLSDIDTAGDLLSLKSWCELARQQSPAPYIPAATAACLERVSIALRTDLPEGRTLLESPADRS